MRFWPHNLTVVYYAVVICTTWLQISWEKSFAKLSYLCIAETFHGYFYKYGKGCHILYTIMIKTLTNESIVGGKIDTNFRLYSTSTS